MARRSHIPVEFIQRGFISGQQRLHKWVIHWKMFESYRINKSRYPRELLLLAFQHGYITRSRKTGEYYQRSWRTLCAGYKSVTYVTIDSKSWGKHSFQDLAYLAAVAYHLKLQEKRKPYGKFKKTLKLSVHFGGVSHSIITSFFGKKSKAWSFSRRRSCEKAKLLRFKRRYRKVPEWSKLPKGEHPELKGHFQTHNGVAREITSQVRIKVCVDFTVPSWVRKERKGA